MIGRGDPFYLKFWTIARVGRLERLLKVTCTSGRAETFCSTMEVLTECVQIISTSIGCNSTLSDDHTRNILVLVLNARSKLSADVTADRTEEQQLWTNESRTLLLTMQSESVPVTLWLTCNKHTSIFPASITQTNAKSFAFCFLAL